MFVFNKWVNYIACYKLRNQVPASDVLFSSLPFYSRHSKHATVQMMFILSQSKAYAVLGDASTY